MTLDEAMAQAASLERGDRFAEAEAIYRQVLAQAPDHAPALLRLARIAQRFGHAQAAAQLAERAAAVHPTADAFGVLGLALHQLKKLAGAEAALRRAAELAPDNASVHFNLGTVLWELGDAVAARDCYSRALAVRPDFAQACHGIMVADGALGRFDEAVRAGRRAASLALNTPRFWCDFGVALLEVGELHEAIAAEERGVALDPQDATLHYNLGQALLLDGDFERGWREVEWRWRCEWFTAPRRNFTQPLWDGAAGAKTVLLHEEQGAGDVIMMARYIALAAERVRVIVECRAPLVELLRSACGAAEVARMGEPLPSFDAQAPLLSLPMIFQTRVDTIPHRVPYLRADAERLRRWRERLGPDTRLKVGVAWAGASTHSNDVNRSTSLETLLPLQTVDGVRFVSLQKPARPRAEWMDDWTDELHDYADTAALVENLDLVISVDTSVAHLAGAMAKPVWTMLPFAPDWRWLARERESSPWYPTMRLFRQTRPRQWGDVVEHVRAALLEVAAKRR
jgi:Flp pilus assembly protein TadD